MIRHKKETIPPPTAVPSAALSFSTDAVDGEHNNFPEWMASVSSAAIARGIIGHFRTATLGWRKVLEGTS